jgi:hypothetical protein
MQSTRAWLASLGAGGSLVAAAACSLLVASAVVAFRSGWPGVRPPSSGPTLTVASHPIVAAGHSGPGVKPLIVSASLAGRPGGSLSFAAPGRPAGSVGARFAPASPAAPGGAHVPGGTQSASGGGGPGPGQSQSPGSTSTGTGQAGSGPGGQVGQAVGGAGTAAGGAVSGVSPQVGQTVQQAAQSAGQTLGGAGKSAGGAVGQLGH